MTNPILTSIDDLREIFFSDGKYLWRVYGGRTAKGGIIGKNQDDDDPESSWEKLESRLTMYSSGYFSIALMNNPSTNNSQADVHVLRLSGDSHEQRTTGFGSSLADTLMLMRYMDDRASRNSSSIGELSDEVTARVKLEFENERLRKEVEELKKGGTAARVAEVAFTKLPRILDHYFPEARGMAGPELGYNDGPATKAAPGAKENGPEKAQSGGAVDFNVVVNAAGILAREIPGANVSEMMACLCRLAIAIEKAQPEGGTFAVLQKLLAFIEAKPEDAINALAWLK